MGNEIEDLITYDFPVLFSKFQENRNREHFSNHPSHHQANSPHPLKTLAFQHKKAPADFSAEAYHSWPTRIRTWK